MAGTAGPRIGKTQAGAGIAVAVALGVALYVTLGGQGNGGASGTCVQNEALAAALDPLVHGEVAALQLAREPQNLSDLTFTGSAGEPLTLAHFEGKLALVNLWATWCGPCRQEMPALDRLEAALGGDSFSVVPISIDTAGRERPQQFLAEIGVKRLPLYTDPTTGIFEALKERGLALGLPVTLLIDANGCHIGRMNGPAEWDSEDGTALIEAAIRAGAAASQS